MNPNKTLVSVLLLSLFTLTAIQGINLLRNGSQVLGDTTGVGTSPPTNVTPRCVDLKGRCAPNCQTGEKPVPVSDCQTSTCCVPFTTNLSPTPTLSRPSPTGVTKSTLSIPCGEIERLQLLYCRSQTTPSPKPSVAVTPVVSTCNNGSRRCRGTVIEVCLGNTWKAGDNCPSACANGVCVTK